MRVFLNGLWAPLLAVQFLTRIPTLVVPDAVANDTLVQRLSFACFPLVGILTGGAVALAIIASRAIGLPILAASIVGVGVAALITGCFHEDGFADTADGMGVRGRERALEVMRDSRIGTFGSVALWFLLSMKVALFGSVASRDLVAITIVAHSLARWSSLPLALLTPNARRGPGLGASFSGLITSREVVIATLLVLAIAVPALGVKAAMLMLGGSIVVVTACGFFYRARFGGLTGDCLGAANQVVELAMLVAAVAAPAILLNKH